MIDVPCLKSMPNEGKVPKENLDVTEKKNPDGSTTFTVKSQKPTEEKPVWISFTVKPDESKEITVTPFNNDKTPAGEPKVFPVPEGSSSTPVEVKFDKPTTADYVVVEFKPKSPSTPAGGDVVSVVSCMPQGRPTSQNIKAILFYSFNFCFTIIYILSKIQIKISSFTK